MAKHFKQTTRKTSTLIYIVLIALIIIAAIYIVFLLKVEMKLFKKVML